MGVQQPQQPQVPTTVTPTGPTQPGDVAEIPMVDIYETDQDVVILANLPGYSPEEIELEATDRDLRIVAKREETRDEREQPLQRERLHRAERVLRLPTTVNVDAAEARCEDGVCRIVLPKTGETQRHRIGVH